MTRMRIGRLQPIKNQVGLNAASENANAMRPAADLWSGAIKYDAITANGAVTAKAVSRVAKADWKICFLSSALDLATICGPRILHPSSAITAALAPSDWPMAIAANPLAPYAEVSAGKTTKGVTALKAGIAKYRARFQTCLSRRFTA